MHTVGSLCTGYGGLDAGVRDVLGGRLAWVADPDPDATRILAHHHPDVPNHGDIRCDCPTARAHPDHQPAGLGDRCRWANVEPVDLLCAGFPCQPWSDAGARRGADDARDLWPAVAHAIAVLRPRLVVLENVARFARLRAGAGRTVGDMADLGYDTRWCLLGADAVGAPHRRLRGFWLAWDRAAADAAADRLARAHPAGRLAG